MEAAIVCFDRAIKIDPKNSIFYSDKCITLNKLKRYDEAIECYNKAIEIDPNELQHFQHLEITLENLRTKLANALKL